MGNWIDDHIRYACWGPDRDHDHAGPCNQTAYSAIASNRQLYQLFYLVRVWTYFALVASCTIGFYYANAYWGGSWAWNVPVTILGVFLMGAGMHQLTALTHEASHFILFKNRWMNELISEFFCMYPVYGSTHLYRLQHIAHHQFVNDPERDPDLAQIHASGHFIGNPAKSGAFKRLLYKQLWLPNVLRFMFVRARFNAVGTDHNPYRRKGTKTSRHPETLALAISSP